MLAADVVTIGFEDGAHRDLPDLRAAAHDDDALAVDRSERLGDVHAQDARHVLHLAHDLSNRRPGGELEVHLGFTMRLLHDIDVLDVGLVAREHLRHTEEHSGLIGDGGENCVRRHERDCTTVAGWV